MGTSLEFNIAQYIQIMPLKGTIAFLTLELNSGKHEEQA